MMSCRSITWLTCILVAVFIAAGNSGPHFITVTDPEVTIYHSTTDNPVSSTLEPVQEMKDMTAMDLGALLDAGDGAVVTLAAGDTQLVAHRAVLAARSPTFETMFSNSSPESSINQVTILDMEGPVLRQLLAYMYTLQTPKLPRMAPQLLAAADDYGLPDLKAECERQVVAQLSVETAAATAVLAIRHSSPSLRQTAVAYIRRHLLHVMGTQGWADAVVNHPHSVVELTHLVLQPAAETSTPAAGDSGATTATQPDSDRSSRSQTPTSAAPATTPQHTPSPVCPTVSCVCTPATEDSEVTPTTQPRSDHSQRSERAPATAAPPADPCSTPPPDVAALCPLWVLSTEEKGRRLIQAANDGSVQEMQMLLALGTDVGVTDGNSNTALHWAAWEGRADAVTCLLRAGAEVNARNWFKNSPLHWAAWAGRVAVVRQLLAYSADPNARNDDQQTPLHLAAQHGATEVATALLDAGAGRWARDKNADRPWDVARKNGNNHLANLLR